jgi:hypothetical protein
MAVTTAAVVGSAATVGGTISARKAAKRAGRAQERAAEAGQGEVRRQFDITQESLRPFREAGERALTQQEALIGLSGPGAQAEALQALQESPGQRFIRKRQERALLRGASAIGGLGGGNVRTALQEQAAGFALQDIDRQFGRLGQIAGQGVSTAVSGGQFGQTAAGRIANLGTTAAEARASGILGRQEATAQGVEQLVELGGQLAERGGKFFGGGK